jgi:hypothetical protein
MSRIARSAKITLLRICRRPCVEPTGERKIFAEVRDAERERERERERETDAFYQTGNLDDYREEQKATF